MDNMTQWRSFSMNKIIRNCWAKRKRIMIIKWVKFNSRKNEENSKNKRRLFTKAC